MTREEGILQRLPHVQLRMWSQLYDTIAVALTLSSGGHVSPYVDVYG